MRNPVILCRFHKASPVVHQRVSLLQALNPGTPIYGLYSGDPQRATEARAAVGDLFVDLQVTDAHGPVWHWLHMDLDVKHWFRRVGHAIDFDYLFDQEYDLLTTAPLPSIYPSIGQDSIALSSLTELTPEVERTWPSAAWPKWRPNYLLFKDYMSKAYGMDKLRYVSHGPGALLSRRFLEQFAETEDVELVISEITYPAYAEALGFTAVDNNLRPTAVIDPRENEYFNCLGEVISYERLLSEAMKPAGRRAFHPVKDPLTPVQLRGLGLPADGADGGSGTQTDGDTRTVEVERPASSGVAVYLEDADAAFVQIPEAGGASLQEALEAVGIKCSLVPLSTSASGVDGPPVDLLAKFTFTFAFVRHPVRWYEAHWRFRGARDGREPGVAHVPGEIDPCLSDDFSTFLRSCIAREPAYVTRLYEWYVGPPGRERVHYVGRHEMLRDALIGVLRGLSYEFDEVALRRQLEALDDARPDGEAWEPDLRDRIVALEAPAIRRFYGDESPLGDGHSYPSTDEAVNPDAADDFSGDGARNERARAEREGLRARLRRLESELRACRERGEELGQQLDRTVGSEEQLRRLLDEARAAMEEREASLQAIHHTRAWRTITRWWRLKRRLTGHW